MKFDSAKNIGGMENEIRLVLEPFNGQCNTVRMMSYNSYAHPLTEVLRLTPETRATHQLFATAGNELVLEWRPKMEVIDATKTQLLSRRKKTP